MSYDYNEDLQREIEGERGNHRSRAEDSDEPQSLNINICPDSKKEQRACLVCALIKVSRDPLVEYIDNRARLL